MNIHQIISWILTSSADPEKVSLFIKSAVAFGVFFGVDATVANEGIGHIVNILTAVGMGLTAMMGLYGLFRKARLGRWSHPK